MRMSAWDHLWILVHTQQPALQSSRCNNLPVVWQGLYQDILYQIRQYGRIFGTGVVYRITVYVAGGVCVTAYAQYGKYNAATQ